MDTLERSDVLIVGAGPAGSYLGYLLARQGCRAQIIDKAEFPRDKVCGGGLSNKTLSLLPFDVSSVVRRRITGAFLTYRNRDTVVKDLDGRGGAIVLRSEFDDLLRGQAVAAGAAFRGRTTFRSAVPEEEGVRVETSCGPLWTRCLVGADGVFSDVRRSLFGPGVVTYVPAVEAQVYVSDDQLDRLGNRALFDFGSMPAGYGWIFPNADHLNAGVFSPYRRREIRQALALFMSTYDVLRAPRAIRHLGFSIPVRNTPQRFERGRVLLVGDAGGFAESVFGEGIYFALKSAEIAARALASGLDWPAEGEYTRLLTSELLPELRYSALNARLFYRWQRFGFYRMARNQHVNGYYAGLVGGLVTHRACFRKTLATLPYWLFSRKLEGYEGRL